MESCGHSANFKWSNVIMQCINQKLLLLMLFRPPPPPKAAHTQKAAHTLGEFSTDRAEIFCVAFFHQFE